MTHTTTNEKDWFGIRGCRLFSLMFFLSIVTPSFANSSLSPNLTVDLAAPLLARNIHFERLHAFVISGDSITAVVVPRASMAVNAILVRTDTVGHLIWTAPLGPEEALDVAVSNSGNVMVLMGFVTKQAPPELLEFNAAGKRVESRGLGGSIRLVALKDEVVGLSSAGVLYGEHSGRLAGVLPANQAADSFAFAADDRISLVSRTNGSLISLGLRDSSMRTTYLSHPLIPKPARSTVERSSNDPAKTALSGIVSYGIQCATGQSGSVYIVPSGFKPKDGVPVIEFGSGGGVLKVFTLTPQNSSKGKILLPTSIVVDKARNIWMGTSVGLLLRYAAR